MQYISLASLGLRTKLSRRLDACIMDRPCAPDCNHSNTTSVSNPDCVIYNYAYWVFPAEHSVGVAGKFNVHVSSNLPPGLPGPDV